jgi:hypothetical protein
MIINKKLKKKKKNELKIRLIKYWQILIYIDMLINDTN